ncbi:MAG: dihydropyrimidinase [Anaerolineae bacterium]|nr:dihydropyrimidinase [Anaerolineae bacterium]
MTYDLIVHGGRAVLPAGVRQVDIGVRGSKIAAIGDLTNEPAATTVDATAKLVFPGFIDPHTHMGIPIKDTWSADDFASGSRSAAFGGTTTILDFTVQAPGQSLRAALDERIGRAQGKSHIDFGVHVNITDQPLKWLHEIPTLVEAGFNSFKVFTTYKEAGMMLPWPSFAPILAEIDEAGGFLMVHAEEDDIVTTLTARHQAAGHTAPIFHARSRSAEAEAHAIERAATIAGDVGARLYIVHLSSKAGLEAALHARTHGVDIVIETCPQYLLLDESVYLKSNGHRWITTPALRMQEDVDTLWLAVENGDIDTIGTDHCPFTTAQKDRYDGAFDQTPNGIPGVENRFPLLYSYGVASGRLSLTRLVDLLSTNVARVFGIDHRKGSLSVGLDADIVVWDPTGETVVSAENQHGNADWTPYAGMVQRGSLVATIQRGRILVQNGQWRGDAIFGDLITTQ